jgi:uncharacterized membrane protein
LDLAQSFAAAQLVAVIMASSLILSEQNSITRWIGIGLIATGILVVALSWSK